MALPTFAVVNPRYPMTQAYVTSEAATATAIIIRTERTGETAFTFFLKLFIFHFLLSIFL
jgi:hypothetical protein